MAPDDWFVAIRRRQHLMLFDFAAEAAFASDAEHIAPCVAYAEEIGGNIEEAHSGIEVTMHSQISER